MHPGGGYVPRPWRCWGRGRACHVLGSWAARRRIPGRIRCGCDPCGECGASFDCSRIGPCCSLGESNPGSAELESFPSGDPHLSYCRRFHCCFQCHRCLTASIGDFDTGDECSIGMKMAVSDNFGTRRYPRTLDCDRGRRCRHGFEGQAGAGRVDC